MKKTFFLFTLTNKHQNHWFFNAFFYSKIYYSSFKFEKQLPIYIIYLIKMFKFVFSSFEFSVSKVARQYKPLVISGCSGSGKSTLISHLTNEKPDKFEFSLSYTTRRPRRGQIHGQHYHFCSIDEFNRLKQANMFIESFNVHGNMYGKPINKLMQIVEKGKVCILDMDIQGGEQVYRKYPDWNFLFLKCPDLNVLRNRLQERATDSMESIEKRLSNAKKQLNRVENLNFYEVMMNNTIEQAKYDLERYIQKKYALDLLV